MEAGVCARGCPLPYGASLEDVQMARSHLLAAPRRSPEYVCISSLRKAWPRLCSTSTIAADLERPGWRRLCRDCLPPFRRGAPAKTPAAERDGFDMYHSLLEKLYEISLRALLSQSYGEFGACEVAEDPFRRVL